MELDGLKMGRKTGKRVGISSFWGILSKWSRIMVMFWPNLESMKS